MFHTKFKTKASRNKEMRENLSIIIASKNKIIRPSTTQKNPRIVGGNNGSIGKVGIADVPPLVNVRVPRRTPNDGWLSRYFSSQPVVRIPTQPSLFSTPSDSTTSSERVTRMPFLFKHVQRPPMEPRTINNENKRNSKQILLQSPWIQRGEPTPCSAQITKQYSIKEIIDMLCGDTPEPPEELELIGKRINFRTSTNTENNEAIALGKKCKTPKL